MNEAEQILVIILSTTLALFLVLAITCAIFLIKILQQIKRITQKAENVADKAEAVADQAEAIGEFFKRSTGPAVIGRFIANMADAVQRKNRNNNKGGYDEE